MTVGKVVAWGGFIVGVLLVSCLAFIQLFPPLFSCENTPIHAAISPDGALKAVLFERDCGATIRTSWQVSIVAAAEHLPDATGNTFVAHLNVDRPEGPPFTTAIELKWQGKRNLQLRYDHSAHVYTKNLRVGDVTAGYKIE